MSTTYHSDLVEPVLEQVEGYTGRHLHIPYAKAWAVNQCFVAIVRHGKDDNEVIFWTNGRSVRYDTRLPKLLDQAVARYRNRGYSATWVRVTNRRIAGIIADDRVHHAVSDADRRRHDDHYGCSSAGR